MALQTVKISLRFVCIGKRNLPEQVKAITFLNRILICLLNSERTLLVILLYFLRLKGIF